MNDMHPLPESDDGSRRGDTVPVVREACAEGGLSADGGERAVGTEGLCASRELQDARDYEDAKQKYLDRGFEWNKNGQRHQRPPKKKARDRKLRRKLMEEAGWDTIELQGGPLRYYTLYMISLNKGMPGDVTRANKRCLYEMRRLLNGREWTGMGYNWEEDSE